MSFKKPVYYRSIQQLAEEMWNVGMHDIHALRRHRHALESITEHAQTKASELDFNGTLFVYEFTSKAYPDRKIRFTFYRLSGRAGLARSTSPTEFVRPTPSTIKDAFEWINEKKPRTAKPRVKKVKEVVSA